eukprot:g12087.t2
MGFQRSLCMSEDGVTRQPEVKLRPMRSGSGFGSFKEAATLKVNRVIEANRQGETLEQMVAEMSMSVASNKARRKGVAKSREERIADKMLWSKNAFGYKTKRYNTPEEVFRQQLERTAVNEEATSPPKQIVFDMRGPQTKLECNMDDLAPQPRSASGDGSSPKLGRELLHKLGLMVAKGPASVDAEYILKAFRMLRENFPEEYAVFGLAQLVPAIIAPAVKKYLADWRPLQAPTRPANFLASCKDFLAESSGRDADGQGRAKLGLGPRVIEFVVEDVVLPTLRSALVNDWDVRDPDPALKLVEAMVVAGVGGGAVHTLREQVVLPKLARGVTDWNPRADAVAVHTWIQPLQLWLPLLRSRLAGLFHEIRRKLEAFLMKAPVGTTTYGILSPWKDVFDCRSMVALLNKCVVPNLVAALRNSLINPANQDMAPFNVLMVWADLLPPLDTTTILDVEFFPKWLIALNRWLRSDTADDAEVASWYWEWKDRFPENLLSDPRVIAKFSAALAIMGQAMQEHQNVGVPLPVGPCERMDDARVLERRGMEGLTTRQHQHAYTLAAAMMAEVHGRGIPTDSFKDVMVGVRRAERGIIAAQAGAAARLETGLRLRRRASLPRPEHLLRRDAKGVRF